MSKEKSFEHDMKETEVVEEVETIEVDSEQSQDTQDVPQDVEEVVEVNDKEHDEQAEKLKQREAELFKKEVSMTLRENGLEMFASIIKPSDSQNLDQLVLDLTKIVNKIKLDTGYIPPKENGVQAEYDVAKEKGDTKTMIKNLFGFNK